VQVTANSARPDKAAPRSGHGENPSGSVPEVQLARCPKATGAGTSLPRPQRDLAGRQEPMLE